MLSQEDRRAIEGLFERLRRVEAQGPDRDPEAESLIAGQVQRQRGAAYYMAQTILVQETALRMAEQRINELEAQVSRRQSGGGLLGGLFGGGDDERREPVRNRMPERQQQQRGPWERDEGYAGRGGGGFLAGAAQTALGVTSGVLLGSAIASMFSTGAHAAEPAADQPSEAEANANEANDAQDSGDTGGDDFGGGDFGGFDGGGFDVGGDF